MVREGLEQILDARADWRGAADVAAGDLADDARFSDLVDDDAVDFLRSSRLPRLRPILVVLAARAAGHEGADPELQYAAELLHTALAIHDFAIGPRGNRRRKLARKVLRSVGWMGSNGLFLRAMELLRAGQDGALLDELIDALRGFHEGQAVMQRLAEQGVPTPEDWSEHADGHTGALMAFCCRAGAVAGGASAAEVAAMGRFGRHLGRMWHLAEDVVLLQDDDAAQYLVGRALAGRPMLPVALAIARDADAAPLWRRLVDDHDAGAAAGLLDTIHRTRSVGSTRETMVREHWAARQELARFPVTPQRHALDRLASGLSRAPYEDRDPAIEAYEAPSR